MIERERRLEGPCPLAVHRRADRIGVGPAGGCQLSSSSSGYGCEGRRFLSRCWSIAALIAIRLSHERTDPPRNERMLRYAEKKASWTASDAWSRSGTIRATSANR